MIYYATLYVIVTFLYLQVLAEDRRFDPFEHDYNEGSDYKTKR